MTVVSLTRIEPDLHPPGPEKVLIQNAPTEPENFDENWFMEFFNNYVPTVKDKTTDGIFAPWFLFKEDFQSIGGHDPLYAPQSKEDSDIFNRFLLNGYNFVQTWEGCVFHLTCRGSRFNPTLTTPGQNSNEWEAQNIRSTRNFIRKWGHFVKHDVYLKPIVPHKYKVEFNITNVNLQYLEMLEPWCDVINTDLSQEVVAEYIKNEQPNTKFDLSKRINVNEESDIVIQFDAKRMTNQSFQFIQNMSEIFDFNNFEIGEYEFDIFNVKVNRVKHYEHDLVKL